MLSPANLQTYIRKAAALTHDVVEAPPFVLFFNPSDDLRFYNYGVPIEPVSYLPDGMLASLGAVFTARSRLLRFEFIQEAVPDLAAAFAAAGLTEEGRNPLLVCTPDSLRPATGSRAWRYAGSRPNRQPPIWLRSSVCRDAASARKIGSIPPTRRWMICAGAQGRGAIISSACWRVSRSLRARTPRRWMASPSWRGLRRWRNIAAAASPARSPQRWPRLPSRSEFR